MSSGITSSRGINSKNPEVGLGVVGKKMLTVVSSVRVLHFAFSRPGNETNGPDTTAWIFHEHRLAKGVRLLRKHRLEDLFDG